jgi:uncharacterized phiE125 gp8 family phage protein
MRDIHWSYEEAVAPTEEPVTLAEARSFARVVSTAQDDDITKFIQAARKVIQAEMKQQLVTATYDLFLDRFPTQIDLPLSPAQSVTTIKYFDTGGNEQTLSSDDYQTDFKKKPARIIEAISASWPAIEERLNAITVRWVAGYGAASAVPQSIKTAIKVVVTYLYEHRLPPDAAADEATLLRVRPLLVGRRWRF